MLIHGTKYDAARVAPVVRQVHCEKCGCDYSYEMIRRGTGATSTAYGLFAKTRATAAVAEAAKSLQQQLVQDHDPVGCPDCGWLQSTMVADLRRRAYRWMMKSAWAISIVLLLFDGFWIAAGISAKLDGAHVRPIGPVVAVVVVAVAIAIVSATAAMQYALRSRIDPNRGYPDQPGYIPGTPQAIKLSDSSPPTPSSGFNRDPKLPYERKRRELEPGGWITVQLARFRCPPLCCKCLSPTSETHTVRITRLARMSVPYCRDCRRRALRSRVLFYAVVMLFCAGMGFFVPVFCGAKFDAGFAAFIAIVFAVLALIASALLSFRYPGPVQFSRFRHDLNTVRLRFRNPAYAGPIIEQGQLT